METKTTFDLAHFFTDNTPAKAAKIGNICLILGSLGAVVGTTIASPPIGIALGLKIAAVSGVVGTIGKTISKLFGEKQIASDEKSSQ